MRLSTLIITSCFSPVQPLVDIACSQRIGGLAKSVGKTSRCPLASAFVEKMKAAMAACEQVEDGAKRLVRALSQAIFLHLLSKAGSIDDNMSCFALLTDTSLLGSQPHVS